MTAIEVQTQALERATQSAALSNYPAIFEGFLAMGIPEAEIKPRENVFTYHAWRALGRQVRKGTHGVRVVTWTPVTREDKTTGETSSFRLCRHTTVFHVSQTDPIE
jgi:antirestriction protein ArdC